MVDAVSDKMALTLSDTRLGCMGGQLVLNAKTWI
jgi:hypothetical protein